MEAKTEAILFVSKRKLKKANSFDVKCEEIKVKNVKSVKYLGLQIDNNLSGTIVIEDIVKNATQG